MIMQKVYIEKILGLLQINHYLFLSIPMIEWISLKPVRPDFVPDFTNVIAYKKFTGSVQ